MKISKMKLSLFAAAAAVSGLAATAAYALWDTSYERIYYSDASHSQQVGHEWRGCMPGDWTITGQVTPYYHEFNTYYCNGDDPNDP